ncbi:MAG: glycoside hydrolase family 18 protein [Planctomycetaceae bacterium]|nr:glycoside hydrolase family 18 protein [Planctomycetaceae bacterium]
MDRRQFLSAIGGAAAGTGVAAAGMSASPISVVGYLPWYRLKGWSASQAGPLTDLVYFGVQPTSDGGMPTDPLDRATLETLRGLKRSIRCRLHLCVGGGDRSAGFPPLVATGRARRDFVRRLRDVCQRGEFDGVDFDWEYPSGDRQLADYRRLIEDTRRSLGDDQILTAAQSPWRDFGRGFYDVIDRIYVMSYNHKHPHARFADSQADIERMLKFGCPRDKLVLGMPFYGRNQRGNSRTYAEIVKSKSFARGSDLIDGFAFNSRRTVQRKTRYARDEQLAGVMVWEVGQDVSDGDESLLSAIGDALG